MPNETSGVELSTYRSHPVARIKDSAYINLMMVGLMPLNAAIWLVNYITVRLRHIITVI